MGIKILRCIIIFAVIGSFIQAITNIKQAIALEDTLTSNDTQEIQKVWEKFLTGFINNDTDSMMKTISPHYSKSIDGTTINYTGIKSEIEKNTAEFFSNHISCSVDNIKILESNIMDNKAVVNFEYNFYAFNKNSMQWITYNMARKVTFSKETGEWKIITTDDKIFTTAFVL
jgi:hypothetical protein